MTFIKGKDTLLRFPLFPMKNYASISKDTRPTCYPVSKQWHVSYLKNDKSLCICNR